LFDEHTSHLQAITGTPCEVPVPRNVIFKRQKELDSKGSLILHFRGARPKKTSQHGFENTSVDAFSLILRHLCGIITFFT
jgi:hypothetical protein